MLEADPRRADGNGNLTMFNNEQIQHLTAKLDASHVKSRQQAGRKLSYIEGWTAIAEANRIFGFHAWHRELARLDRVQEQPTKIGRDNPKDGHRVSYIATVRIRVLDSDGKEIIREGTGYGQGIDVDLGQAHESAVKEAETDAMKRALMTFGNPFGLALYDKEQKEVEKSGERRAENGAGAQKTEASRTNGKTDPTAWWASPNLAIPVKEKNWQEWDKRMYAAIKAAPNFDGLMKLQMDNADNLDGYFSAHPDAHKNLMNAFATRAGNLSQEPAA